MIVVFGGTGDAGSRLLGRLSGRTDVRAVARSAQAARRLADLDVQVTNADLADPHSLDAAFDGATRVFLVSSPTRHQVELESNAIVAAERAGVERIVRISNLAIDGLDTGLHGNHREIERRLAASAVASTVLQPSVFASWLTRQLPLLRLGRLVAPFGEGRVAYVDPEDIASVAAVALVDRDRVGDETIPVTGPELLSASELAERVAAAIGREVRVLDPPIDEWIERVEEQGMDRWLAISAGHLYRAIAERKLEICTRDVERTTGLPARPVDDFIEREVVAGVLSNE